MDEERFDRITRLLGRATGRRGAIATIFAGVLPLGAAAKSGKRPAAEGPCGDNPAVSRCKKHADCCTGYCKNGKCRGVKRGGTCNAIRKCRGTAVCVNGRCTPQGGANPGPTPPCDASTCATGCCDGTTCVPYAQQQSSKCGTSGAACAACTGSDVCDASGVCGPLCDTSTCRQGCCDSGTCVAYADQTSIRCGANGAACQVCTGQNASCSTEYHICQNG